MKLIASFAIAVAVFSCTAYNQDLSERFNATQMRNRVKRLSADDFEGRGPGTDGGRRAAQFIASELKAMGVKPANHGSYFQNVKLVGVKADPNTKLVVSGKNKTQAFDFGDEFVATTGAQTKSISVNAELVFVGYGIESSLYHWNDYKGPAADYRGKVLLMLVNDPPATKDEPDLFGSNALTYYGRWTYKYEEAARRGAAGVILIHTTESAGYGWNVVRTSNGNWRYEIARSPSDTTPFLKFKSWMTNDAAVKLLKHSGFDLDELRRKAQSRSFVPVELGLKVKLDLNSETKTFASPNVIGIVPGRDSKLRSEYVAFTSHWDHLGIGEPNAAGDRIYNGAYDNASGVSALLGVAGVVAKLPLAARPARSFIFIFTTAEEQGLLGAEFYSHQPLVPLNKTVADINIDGVNFFGKVADFMPLGAERSTLLESIKEVASQRNLTIKADGRPEQGFFFRSDHFPFAKVGVPSVSLQHGDAFLKPLGADAAGFFKDYTAKYYHQVTDEFHDWWDMTAMIQEAEFTLAIGMKLANDKKMPRFNENDEFSEADKHRFVR